MLNPADVRRTDDEIRGEHERYSTEFLYGLLAATVFDPRSYEIIRQIIKERRQQKH